VQNNLDDSVGMKNMFANFAKNYETRLNRMVLENEDKLRKLATDR